MKECTEADPNTPLRVKNVLYKTIINWAMVRIKVVFSADELLCEIIMVCKAPTITSQAIYTPFSTGSQFQ
ncbi:hypothetical protein FQZ97_1119390 [compost metagenome]